MSDTSSEWDREVDRMRALVKRPELGQSGKASESLDLRRQPAWGRETRIRGIRRSATVCRHCRSRNLHAAVQMRCASQFRSVGSGVQVGIRRQLPAHVHCQSAGRPHAAQIMTISRPRYDQPIQGDRQSTRSNQPSPPETILAAAATGNRRPQSFTDGWLRIVPMYDVENVLLRDCIDWKPSSLGSELRDPPRTGATDP